MIMLTEGLNFFTEEIGHTVCTIKFNAMPIVYSNGDSIDSFIESLKGFTIKSDLSEEESYSINELLDIMDSFARLNMHGDKKEGGHIVYHNGGAYLFKNIKKGVE